MLKKLLLVLLGAMLTMAIILLVNALRLGHNQVEPGTEPAIEINDEPVLERFSASLRYKTISGDDGAEMDSTAFYDYLGFLRVSFPSVHNTLEDTLFNDLTPLYYWEGSDPSLDPVLLMGHYDVVPVDSSDIDGWAYPPFSGELADGYVWGRGAVDNKFNVMALLESAEYLLSEGFQPTRSIYFSFGHDEEIGGNNGARAVARYMQDHDITPHLVLDEGGAVVSGVMPFDRPAATIGIAEKGYISLELTAKSDGGHSSQPGDTLAVTMLSKAIVDLDENPFPVKIDGVTEQMFDSVAEKMPFTFQIIYGNRWLLDGMLKNELKSSPSTAAMVRTTIAPTILRAGVKDNVLPNEARAVVNFRILPGDSFESVKDHVQTAINNDNIQIQEYGTTMVPPSRISNINSSSYRLLQQSIMDSYRDVYVMPYLVMGATDSRHFTNLTDQVYRFSPFLLRSEDMGIIHGTNERVETESYLGGIRFYSHFIQMAAGH